MNKKLTVKQSVRLRKTDYENIQKYQKTNDKNFSEVVRIAIAQFLQNQQTA